MVQHVDLLRVGIERGPDVVVDGDHHLTVQVLCHAQHIRGRDLVRDTDGILTERSQRHINIEVLAVLQGIVGKM